MKRQLVTLLLLTACAGAWCAAPVAARDVANGSAVRDNVGSPISGWDTVTSAWRTITATINGYLKVQNNPIYRLESTSLLNTDLPAKQLFKTNTPVYAQDISKITCLASWAAADTDSVALEVFVVGKISGTAADGLDYFVDMDPSTPRLDGVFVGRKTGYWTDSPIGTSGMYATSSPLVVTVAGKAATPIPSVPFAGVGSAAASFSITPKYGSQPGFTYYSFWVVNVTNTQIDDVSLLCIVRGD